MTADALSLDMAARTATAGSPIGTHVVTPQQAKKTGQQFEAMFMTQMFQHMFEGIKSDGWFGGGSAEESFRPMLLEQYGKMMAQSTHGVGIADAVARSLLHAQEHRNDPGAS